MRILINAEAFGFGPSAAAAQAFAALKGAPGVSGLDYAGSGHSLDLQWGLGYGRVIQIHEGDEAAFKALVGGYDGFVTAMDFQKARWAHEAGTRPVVYDLLAWHWEQLPSEARLGGYVAQEFFGVRQRLDREGMPKARVVDPIFEPTDPPSGPDLSLINFGGLENPFWDLGISASYVQLTLEAIELARPPHPLEIACSGRHAAALNGSHRAKARTRAEMKGLIGRARLIVATPGLGNLMECAASGAPCVLMPPANDSQGRQSRILERLGFSSQVTWEELGFPMDYDAPQAKTMGDIARAIASVDRERLAKAWSARISSASPGGLSWLRARFGDDGAAQLRAALRAELGLPC